MLDAKRGEVYAYVQDIASSAVLVEAAVLPIEDLATVLDQAARPVLLSGAGAPLVAAVLADPDMRVVGTSEAPDIETVAKLGLRARIASPPVPLYARAADAMPQAGKAVARA